MSRMQYLEVGPLRFSVSYKKVRKNDIVVLLVLNFLKFVNAPSFKPSNTDYWWRNFMREKTKKIHERELM